MLHKAHNCSITIESRVYDTNHNYTMLYEPTITGKPPCRGPFFAIQDFLSQGNPPSKTPDL
jgi:hypothetical protein